MNSLHGHLLPSIANEGKRPETERFTQNHVYLQLGQNLQLDFGRPRTFSYPTVASSSLSPPPLLYAYPHISFTSSYIDDTSYPKTTN